MPNLNLSSTELSPWQSRQAAMLYKYSSIEYLKQLHQLVSDMINGLIDPLLAVSKAQARDALLADAHWGTRNTSENWANNAWPMLKDLQAELAKDISFRSFEKFRVTSVNECLRGVEQFSMLWTTEHEENQYQSAVALINEHALKIDSTVDARPAPRWTDYTFAYDFASFISESPRIPRFRIRSDLTSETGKMPPRTGVYISADDPHAALQFAAAGPGGFNLRRASTFNEVGLDALSAVGRADLWVDNEKMLKFALNSPKASIFVPHIHFFGKDEPDLAPSAVARYAFSEHPSMWYYVEKLEDEAEDAEIEWAIPAAPNKVVRLVSGEICKESGYYFSPANPASRRFFRHDEIMPAMGSDFGNTVWQWDPRQG